jgi:hypothetical protein
LISISFFVFFQDIVNVTKDGKKETLQEVIDRLNIKIDQFTLDALDTRVLHLFSLFLFSSDSSLSFDVMNE